MDFTGASFCSVDYQGNSGLWTCISNGGVIPEALRVFPGGRWMVQARFV